MTEPASEPDSESTTRRRRRRRGRRWNNFFTALALVASGASLWFAWQGVKAQQTQTEMFDHEVEVAVVSKVSYWFHSTKLHIENRSLSPVYEISLDMLDEKGNLLYTATPGDLMACKRAEMDLAGATGVFDPRGNFNTKLRLHVSLTDHRDNHWLLTQERKIEQVDKFNYVEGAEAGEDLATKLGRTFTLFEPSSCG